MDSGMDLRRLEEYVDNLLARFDDLKQRHRALQAELADREARVAALEEQVAQLEQERQMVGDRVSGLLQRISAWQENEEEPAQASAAGEGEREDSPLFGGQ